MTPTPLTEVLTLLMSKSSAKGIKAPSARTKVSADALQGREYVREKISIYPQ